jgi:recombination protein RecA
MSTIEEVLARLNPKTAQSFRIASKIENELLPTPSLGINMAIGGLGYGRFTVLWGNKGSGKTLLSLGCAAQAQKQGKTVAWMDVEKNFEPSWARKNGVNPDLMIVDNQTISVAGMADKACDLITSGIDVLVIDSISQLLPQSFFEDPKNGKEELKGLSETGQIGTFSKNLGQAINMMNSVNQHTAIIIISQIRNKIGNNGAAMTFMGGYALEHAASTVIKSWRTPSEVIESEVHMGDGMLLKRPVGYPATWTIDKNRGPGMKMSNTYNVYTGGDFIGIDLSDEIVTYGVEFGIIKKGGAWYHIGDDKFQGKDKIVKYLRDNPDIQEKIYGEILAKSV